MFQRIEYDQLNSRQKENFNFQKLSSQLAEYGFSCMWLNDDWQGADFIANHIDGSTFLKVQLKGRLTIDRKYNGKDVYVAFREGEQWYIYPHDQLQEELLASGFMEGTKAWEEGGAYSWPSLTGNLKEHLSRYAL